MKFQTVPVTLTLLLACCATCEPIVAGDRFFSHRQRTRTKLGLPNYDYGNRAWPFTQPSSFGTSAIAVAASSEADSARGIRPFHFRTNAMTIDHLTLSNVGLSLDRSAGKLYASGTISHHGADGGLIGNHVTIRIHAYIAHTAALATVPGPVSNPPPALLSPSSLPAPLVNDDPARSPRENPRPLVATPNEVTRIPPDAYRVWSSKKTLWVSRDRPQTIDLIKTTQNQSDLSQHFDQITHLRVELEYHRDR